MEGFLVDGRQNADIADTLQLRDVAMATNFGTALYANGLWREITTWGFRIKDGLFSVSPASVGRSLWIGSCGDRNCSRRATVRLGIDTLITNILVIDTLYRWRIVHTHVVLSAPIYHHSSLQTDTAISSPCHYYILRVDSAQVYSSLWKLLHCVSKWPPFNFFEQLCQELLSYSWFPHLTCMLWSFFNNIIHTYCWLFTLSQNKTNCNRDCELAHHIWKM